jgi:hypothetical protein
VIRTTPTPHDPIQTGAVGRGAKVDLAPHKNKKIELKIKKQTKTLLPPSSVVCFSCCTPQEIRL